MIPSTQILKALEWRYAVKKFDSKQKISESDWKTLEQSIILSPSSYGTQPYQFVLVQNAEIRQALKPHSWDQTQIVDASHLLVLTALKKVDEAYVNKYLARMSEVRGMPVSSLEGFKKMLMGDLVQGPRSQIIEHWAAKQAYIAFGNMMTVAAMMGIDTCPIEGLFPAEYDRILSLTNTPYQTLAVCAFGYRDASDPYAHHKKVRFESKDLFKVVS